MRNYKFSTMFLFCSWIIFIASQKSIVSCILLMLSGLYALIEVIPKLKDWKKDNAKR